MIALYAACSTPQGMSELQPAQVPEVASPGNCPGTHSGYHIDFMLGSSVTGLVLRKENVW